MVSPLFLVGILVSLKSQVCASWLKMPNESSPVSCLQCGIEIGFASPGSFVQCWKCGKWIKAVAPIVGVGNAIAAGLVLVGFGALVVLGLKALGDFLDSL